MVKDAMELIYSWVCLNFMSDKKTDTLNFFWLIILILSSSQTQLQRMSLS